MLRHSTLVALAAFFVAASPTSISQDSRESKEISLDEAIKVALAHSPAILIADAKVRSAQAELSQVRMTVTKEVLKLFQNMAVLQAEYASANSNLERAMHLHKSGSLSQGELAKARLMVVRLKSERALLRSQREYLLGGARAKAKSTAVESPKLEPPAIPAHSKNLIESFVDLDRTAKTVGELAPDVFKNLEWHRSVVRGLAEGNDSVLEVRPTRKSMSVRALFLWFHDQYGVVFVLRPYGVLVTSGGHAKTLSAPTIPAVRRSSKGN